MEIKGKVVLITGASGALGQSVVPTFVSAGAILQITPSGESGTGCFFW
jgi:NAD(P)-dependent dehydrogenase (short-subunit alcohol dehydrogenase family)